MNTTSTSPRITSPSPGASPAPAPAAPIHVRWAAWLVAAWALGFAVVNVVLQLTLDRDLFPSWTAFTALNMSMVALKVVGAGVALDTISSRRRLPARWTSLLASGGAAVLVGYAAILFVMMGASDSWMTTVSAGGVLDVPAVAYAAFFALPGLALATAAVDHRRRHDVPAAWMMAGAIGAPVLLATLMAAMAVVFR